MIRQRNQRREYVYRTIDGERDYQDDGKGNARRDEEGAGPLSVGESILCIDKLLLDAKLDWYKPSGISGALEHLRKVAAVAVAALERHGAPPREGYEVNSATVDLADRLMSDPDVRIMGISLSKVRVK